MLSPICVRLRRCARRKRAVRAGVWGRGGVLVLAWSVQARAAAEACPAWEAWVAVCGDRGGRPVVSRSWSYAFAATGFKDSTVGAG
jgi:hypothetical protein